MTEKFCLLQKVSWIKCSHYLLASNKYQLLDINGIALAHRGVESCVPPYPGHQTTCFEFAVILKFWSPASDTISRCYHGTHLKPLFSLGTCSLLILFILIYCGLGNLRTENIPTLCKLFANSEAQITCSVEKQSLSRSWGASVWINDESPLTIIHVCGALVIFLSYVCPWLSRVMGGWVTNSLIL